MSKIREVHLGEVAAALAACETLSVGRGRQLVEHGLLNIERRKSDVECDPMDQGDDAALCVEEIRERVWRMVREDT